jgi:hypothetical protein
MNIESGSIAIAVMSMIVLGFGLWIIKKMGEL